uniref:Uncharacterized protein n=1 Tax=Timema shepardi TaxID=629360 RepID=A0A7R9G555_TIMSH|nr:unnamed protein product [Timema shepardi]
MCSSLCRTKAAADSDLANVTALTQSHICKKVQERWIETYKRGTNTKWPLEWKEEHSSHFTLLPMDKESIVFRLALRGEASGARAHTHTHTHTHSGSERVKLSSAHLSRLKNGRPCSDLMQEDVDLTNLMGPGKKLTMCVLHVAGKKLTMCVLRVAGQKLTMCVLRVAGKRLTMCALRVAGKRLTMCVLRVAWQKLTMCALRVAGKRLTMCVLRVAGKRLTMYVLRVAGKKRKTETAPVKKEIGRKCSSERRRMEGYTGRVIVYVHRLERLRVVPDKWDCVHSVDETDSGTRPMNVGKLSDGARNTYDVSKWTSEKPMAAAEAGGKQRFVSDSDGVHLLTHTSTIGGGGCYN